MTPTPAALLLLTDGRFPSGGYAHSGGIEAAVHAGRVHDLPTLEAFVVGRAATTGAVAAAFAACAAGAAADPDRLSELDTEFDSRTPSPALRTASRALGRQLRRAVGSVRPDPRLDRLGDAPHQPIAVGVVAAVFDLGPRDAALGAAYESVAGPATAAVRLLGVDPFDVHALLARLTSQLDAIATAAARQVDASVADLPASGAPLLDIGAEHHAREGVRLFAS